MSARRFELRVLIVGAGPPGLTAAVALAGYGIRTRSRAHRAFSQ
jgi:ribulose 1,5-bisphosphate synthetase/thiazole synthase